MFAAVHTRLNSFARHESGAIAVMAAFLLPAVVLLIGMAFDYNRISGVQRAYQLALDDTITSARFRRLHDNDLLQFARTHFAAQLGPERAKTVTALEFTRDADGIGALATGRITAPFFALLRIPHFDLKVEANEKLFAFNERSLRTPRTR